jgi:hypothetical protein
MEPSSRSGKTPQRSVILETLAGLSTLGIGEAGDPDLGEQRRFIPSRMLHEYMSMDRIRELVTAVFAPDESPVRPDDIFPNYVEVFCILLRIGRGNYIEYFVRMRSLSSAQLPLNLDLKPGNFPRVNVDPGLYKTFCRSQWEFCAAVFRSPMVDVQFEDDRVLPIVQKDLLGEKHGAKTYRIRLEESYDKLVQGVVRDNWLYPILRKYTNAAIQMDSSKSVKFANTYVVRIYATKDVAE